MPAQARSHDLVDWQAALRCASWEMAAARAFSAEPDLFAAPLVQDRDGDWALLGFRNQESEGNLSFEIVDPIPVELRDGALVAAEDR